MSWLTTLLFPNFNLDALIGPLIAVVGIILVVLAGWLSAVPDLKKMVSRVGLIMISGGLIYWIAISVLQDIFADPKLWGTVLTFIIVAVIGFLIFWEQKKK